MSALIKGALGKSGEEGRAGILKDSPVDDPRLYDSAKTWTGSASTYFNAMEFTQTST